MSTKKIFEKLIIRYHFHKEIMCKSYSTMSYTNNFNKLLNIALYSYL